MEVDETTFEEVVRTACCAAGGSSTAPGVMVESVGERPLRYLRAHHKG